ncbi:MAG: heavy metal-associated domain-containing protein [Phoenicibacter congonensis]|uniref:Heavy metal-associated domain-containing protein n=1 Tax=Phoenicibacter congonensis TaxID=1944646 RepID=A0AA43U6J0_9ACTN|nr:heavy metal-associated domain-containing protein [Phoenicibacter congonensis]
MEHVINVNGMACEGCVKSVTEALEKVAGVESVNVSLEDKKAVVQAADSVTVEALEAAVKGAGFEVA